MQRLLSRLVTLIEEWEMTQDRFVIAFSNTYATPDSVVYLSDNRRGAVSVDLADAEIYFSRQRAEKALEDHPRWKFSDRGMSPKIIKVRHSELEASRERKRENALKVLSEERASTLKNTSLSPFDRFDTENRLWLSAQVKAGDNCWIGDLARGQIFADSVKEVTTRHIFLNRSETPFHRVNGSAEFYGSNHSLFRLFPTWEAANAGLAYDLIWGVDWRKIPPERMAVLFQAFSKEISGCKYRL